MINEWLQLLRREFHGYGAAAVQRDLLAGLTVAAVALPLALAFGVASGADAAAGLVTAVAAGVLISALGGSPYQISGPTGAMSAVLIAVALRHGLAGVQMAGLLAGVMILLVGVLRLGRLVSLIPAPVITGFTSGIAVVIATGQLEAFFGTSLPAAETSLERLASLRHGVVPEPRALATALLVMLIMWQWRRARRWQMVPGSLIGIVVATAVAEIAAWPVARIGEVPATLLLDERLRLASLPWEKVPDLLVPAFSIAALGAIETLLCGAVAGNMTRIRMHNNIELVAQGIGNVVVPFLGGVPATAAIARTSVGIRSGAATRLTGVFHGMTLLLIALVAAPVIGRVPLAALAGVLMVTAWRMNEWQAIRYFFSRRLRHAMLAFSVTLVATVALDLTQAIFIGVGLSTAIFLAQVSELQAERQPVDPGRLVAAGRIPAASVYYLSGPLFFATSRSMLERIETLDPPSATVILSIRGVPLVDATGLEVLRELIERQRHGGGRVLLCSIQPRVESMLRRSGLWAELGEESCFWSADRAILSLGAALPPEPPVLEPRAETELGVEGRLIAPHEQRMVGGDRP